MSAVVPAAHALALAYIAGVLTDQEFVREVNLVLKRAQLWVEQ